MAKNKARLPHSPCMWAWNSKYHRVTDRIREALGVKGSKLPRDMHGEYRIDGWNVVVKRGAPKTPGLKTWDGKQRYVHSAKHRIFVRHEGRLIPVGRVYQALCVPYKKGSRSTRWAASSNLSGSRRRK